MSKQICLMKWSSFCFVERMGKFSEMIYAEEQVKERDLINATKNGLGIRRAEFKFWLHQQMMGSTQYRNQRFFLFLQHMRADMCTDEYMSIPVYKGVYTHTATSMGVLYDCLLFSLFQLCFVICPKTLILPSSDSCYKFLIQISDSNKILRLFSSTRVFSYHTALEQLRIWFPAIPLTLRGS